MFKALWISGIFAGDRKSWRRFENYSTLVEHLLDGRILSVRLFFSWPLILKKLSFYSSAEGFLKVPTQRGGGQDLV